MRRAGVSKLLTLGLFSLAGTARSDGFVYVGRGGRAYEMQPTHVVAEGAPQPQVPSAPPWPVQSTCDRQAHLPLVREAAEMYSIPMELVYAVMRVESRCDPRAISRKGALGRMQLMPATAASLGVTDPFDPKQNIYGGVHFLRVLINEFDGSLALALAGYNAGPGAVRRAGGIPPIPETQQYVIAVLAQYHALLGLRTLRVAAAPATSSRPLR